MMDSSVFDQNVHFQTSCLLNESDENDEEAGVTMNHPSITTNVTPNVDDDEPQPSATVECQNNSTPDFFFTDFTENDENNDAASEKRNENNICEPLLESWEKRPPKNLPELNLKDDDNIIINNTHSINTPPPPSSSAHYEISNNGNFKNNFNFTNLDETLLNSICFFPCVDDGINNNNIIINKDLENNIDNSKSDNNNNDDKEKSYSQQPPPIKEVPNLSENKKLFSEVENAEFIKKNNGYIVSEKSAFAYLDNVVDFLTGLVSLNSSYNMRNFGNFQPLFSQFLDKKSSKNKATTGTKKGIGDNLSKDFFRFLKEYVKTDDEEVGPPVGEILKRKRGRNKEANKKPRKDDILMGDQKEREEEENEKEEERGKEEGEEEERGKKANNKKYMGNSSVLREEEEGKEENDKAIRDLHGIMANEKYLKELRSLIEKTKDMSDIKIQSILKLLNEFNNNNSNSTPKKISKKDTENTCFLEKLINIDNGGSGNCEGVVNGGGGGGGGGGDSEFEIPVSSVGVTSTQRLYQVIHLLNRLKRNRNDLKISTNITKTVTDTINFKDVVPFFTSFHAFNHSLIEHILLIGSILGWDDYRQNIVRSGGLSINDIFQLMHLATEMMTKNYHNQIASVS